MSLLKNVGVIVGNSSAGIAEAPLFNTPCVNIGIREEGREQAGNVINTPHNKKLIADAIKRALSKKFRDKVKKSKNPYNSNNVEKRIIKVLLNTKIDSKLINKKLTY
jgi:UDP-N-acetylglucosamine 2-epimerase